MYKRKQAKRSKCIDPGVRDQQLLGKTKSMPPYPTPQVSCATASSWRLQDAIFKRSTGASGTPRIDWMRQTKKLEAVPLQLELVVDAL